jgi:hypothetical protein
MDRLMPAGDASSSGDGPRLDAQGWVTPVRAALAVALFASVFFVPYLPTNDGPQHVLSAHIENHYSDPDTIYALLLVPAPQFAAKGFALIFGLLEALVPWHVALRITLGAIAAATGLAASQIALALEPRRHAAAFLVMGLAVHWHLYMGFFKPTPSETS